MPQDLIFRLALAAFAMFAFSAFALAEDKPPQPAAQPAPEKTDKAADPNAWKELFDGKTLKGWKEADYVNKGKVEVKDGSIVIAKGNDMTGIVYNGKPPRENYELTLEGQRLAGSDFFCSTTFPVGKECVTLVVGGWGGSLVGISSIDGFDASENATSTSKEFANNKWYKIKIRVTKAKIEAWIDGDSVVDHERPDHKFDTRLECDACKPLGVATWQTTGAVRNIKIRELKADDAK